MLCGDNRELNLFWRLSMHLHGYSFERSGTFVRGDDMPTSGRPQ